MTSETRCASIHMSSLVGADRVVVIRRRVGKGKGSGVEIDRPDHQIFTIREGRIVLLAYGYTERAEALAAAGLRE
jgi:ketosteroid isomerase-like protein